MSLEETKRLLQIHKIAPNKLLGQNFMIETAFFPKLSEYASVDKYDVVLDAGAGFGFLTCFLANKCKAVVAVEKDLQIAKVLREQVRDLGNVNVVEGDVLKAKLPAFNKAVALPPYYLSTDLVLWLLERGVDCAVLVVQREFASRIVAGVGTEQYGWLAVAVAQQAEVELLDFVSKTMFYPEPEVDSIIIRIKPCIQKTFTMKDKEFFVDVAKCLFTERNKKLSNAVVPFLRGRLKLSKEEAQKIAATIPFRDKRVLELSPRQIGEVANAICN